jgi:hypothetical protein
MFARGRSQAPPAGNFNYKRRYLSTSLLKSKRAMPTRCSRSPQCSDTSAVGRIVLQNDFEPRSEENFFQIKAE